MRSLKPLLLLLESVLCIGLDENEMKWIGPIQSNPRATHANNKESKHTHEAAEEARTARVQSFSDFGTTVAK